MKSGSSLERLLEAGEFVVTAEIGPTKGADPEFIKRKGEMLRGYADAYNVTENQTAVVRMSSMAACTILHQMGLEPVMQMVCRDKNRIALQSDVLGAAALGIKNILALTGDHQKFGNQPGAKGVYDIDSIQLIQALREMRDEKRLMGGDELKTSEPRLFIGGVINPFQEPMEISVMRLEKKVAAGADFIQTQAIFDVERFGEWMELVRERGLHEKTAILAGVAPVKSPRIAARMRDVIPGMHVPDVIVERMESASDAGNEGKEIAAEFIKELNGVEGTRGVHVMAILWEAAVPDIIVKSGLHPRPKI